MIRRLAMRRLLHRLRRWHWHELESGRRLLHHHIFLGWHWHKWLDDA